MPEKIIACPNCHQIKAVECADEVDIGVGIQRHVYGYECANCGRIPVCSVCGAINECHHAWCAEFRRDD